VPLPELALHSHGCVYSHRYVAERQMLAVRARRFSSSALTAHAFCYCQSVTAVWFMSGQVGGKVQGAKAKAQKRKEKSKPLDI